MFFSYTLLTKKGKFATVWCAPGAAPPPPQPPPASCVLYRSSWGTRRPVCLLAGLTTALCCVREAANATMCAPRPVPPASASPSHAQHSTRQQLRADRRRVPWAGA